jgi:hypothetical protein
MNIKTLLIGILIGFVTASPFYLISNNFAIEQVNGIFFSLLFLLIGAVGGGLVCYLFYRRLLKSVLDFTNSGLERIAADAVSFVFSIPQGDVAKAEEAAKRIGSRLGARLSDLIFIRGMFYIITSILVAVGTTFGTIVLIQQNQLIEEQTGKIVQQTKLMNVQTIAEKFAQTNIIGEKINDLTTLESQLGTTAALFHRISDVTIEVKTRSPRISQTLGPHFNLNVRTTSFRIQTCEKQLNGETLVETEKNKCLFSNPLMQLRLIPDQTFEMDIDSIGILSMITWLGELSQQHSQIDGSTPEKDRRYLSNFIKTARAKCNVEPEIANKFATLAQTARNLEVAGSSLHWLFRFGFPAIKPDEDKEYKARLQSQISSFAFNMIDSAIKLQNFSENRPLTTQEMLEILELLYKELQSGLEKIQEKCHNTKVILEELGTILHPLRNNDL